MDDAAGNVTADRDGILEGLNSEAGFHPIADGVPDDPSAEGVFDRAAVELAFAGLVFRDVHQPELVRCVGYEQWQIVPSGERSAIAFRIAALASDDFMRVSIEYPTILFDQTSLIAQM